MAIGLSRPSIEHDLQAQLQEAASALTPEQVEALSRAVAAIIEKNNQEIDRELGRRVADIERKIGRR